MTSSILVRWAGALLLAASAAVVARADCAHSTEAPAGLLNGFHASLTSRVRFEPTPNGSNSRTESTAANRRPSPPNPEEVPCLHCGSRQHRIPVPGSSPVTPLDAVVLFSEQTLDLSPQAKPGEAQPLYSLLLVISIEHPPR